MPAKVDAIKCNGCETCLGACPVEAIKMISDKAIILDDCISCGACVPECPEKAISME